MVEFVLLLLAVLCGLSRISDYKHHWSDVFAGLVMGTFIAFFFVFRVLKLHRVNTSSNQGQSGTNIINTRQNQDVEREGDS